MVRIAPDNAVTNVAVKTPQRRRWIIGSIIGLVLVLAFIGVLVAVLGNLGQEAERWCECDPRNTHPCPTTLRSYLSGKYEMYDECCEKIEGCEDCKSQLGGSYGLGKAACRTVGWHAGEGKEFLMYFDVTLKVSDAYMAGKSSDGSEEDENLKPCRDQVLKGQLLKRIQEHINVETGVQINSCQPKYDMTCGGKIHASVIYQVKIDTEMMKEDPMKAFWVLPRMAEEPKNRALSGSIHDAEIACIRPVSNIEGHEEVPGGPIELGEGGKTKMKNVTKDTNISDITDEELDDRGDETGQLQDTFTGEQSSNERNEDVVYEGSDPAVARKDATNATTSPPGCPIAEMCAPDTEEVEVRGCLCTLTDGRTAKAREDMVYRWLKPGAWDPTPVMTSVNAVSMFTSDLRAQDSRLYEKIQMIRQFNEGDNPNSHRVNWRGRSLHFSTPAYPTQASTEISDAIDFREQGGRGDSAQKRSMCPHPLLARPYTWVKSVYVSAGTNDKGEVIPAREYAGGYQGDDYESSQAHECTCFDGGSMNFGALDTDSWKAANAQTKDGPREGHPGYAFNCECAMRMGSRGWFLTDRSRAWNCSECEQDEIEGENAKQDIRNDAVKHHSTGPSNKWETRGNYDQCGSNFDHIDSTLFGDPAVDANNFRDFLAIRGDQYHDEYRFQLSEELPKDGQLFNMFVNTCDKEDGNLRRMWGTRGLPRRNNATADDLFCPQRTDPNSNVYSASDCDSHALGFPTQRSITHSCYGGSDGMYD